MTGDEVLVFVLAIICTTALVFSAGLGIYKAGASERALHRLHIEQGHCQAANGIWERCK